MGPKTLVLGVTIIALAIGAAFVATPAFPEPSTLISSDYGTLQSQLGPPTVVFGDKFVGWERSRLIAAWTLEAGIDFPLQPRSRPSEIHRCLWVQWAGYAMLCRWSSARRSHEAQVPHMTPNFRWSRP